MKLPKEQIDRIYQKHKIDLPNGKSIVWINVPIRGWKEKERNYNVYCIDSNFDIVWQVTEPYSKPVAFEGKPPNDPFCYLGQNESGEILADRFSGFEYKIDPETGAAKRIGFHK